MSDSEPTNQKKPSAGQQHGTNTETIHILITQCLQNAFFLAEKGRLCLPELTVKQMLVGTNSDTEDTSPDPNRRIYPKDKLQKGPLYTFLDTLISNVSKDRELYVLHLRDWHTPSPRYDAERRLYGGHCEAGTWEAEPLAGYEKFLMPWGNDNDQAQSAQSLKGYRQTNENGGKIIYYDVRSDSVFDFKEPVASELYDVYQRALAQRREQGDRAAKIDVDEQCGDYYADTFLEAILDQVIKDKQRKNRRAGRETLVYVTVIGVYTDIKIRTLINGLRTRYETDGLLVSDVLTASPDIERSLAAYDFFDKVLNVEVVHSLTELLRPMLPNQDVMVDESIIKGLPNFRDYKTFFLDKQTVLASQDNKLLDYLELTQKRSGEVYTQIYKANWWLLWMGRLFLSVALLLVVLQVGVKEVVIPTEVWVLTGGLSIAQLLTSFFLIPMAQMRNNVNALVRLQNYLETYSTISSLLRFHMTRANQLNPQDTARSTEELTLVEKQMTIIQNAAQKMSDTFSDIPVKDPN